MVNVLKHVWIVEHFYSQMWIKKCYVQVWPSLNRAYYHENRIAYYKVWKFLLFYRYQTTKYNSLYNLCKIPNV